MGADAPPLRGPGADLPRNFPKTELFERDLSEVYLLIDFISGRADKSLAGLKDVTTQDAAGNSVDKMLPQKVVEEICKLRYPPQDSPEQTAQQAAFLLVVKDRLNYLAAPARGLTVAFTSMFAGVSLRLIDNWRWPLTAVRPEQPAHYFSAREAYPNLEAQARNFRIFYNRLPLTAFALILFIAYTNWDVSVTGAILKEISNAEKEYGDLISNPKAFQPTIGNCQSLDAAQNMVKETSAEIRSNKTGSDRKASVTADKLDLATLNRNSACLKARSLEENLAASREDLQDLMYRRATLQPVALSALIINAQSGNSWFNNGSRQSRSPQVGVGGALLRPTNQHQPLVHSSLDLSGEKHGNYTVHDASTNLDASGLRPAAKSSQAISASVQALAVENQARAILVALNSIVIPVAFGWLGTITGLARSVTAKVRENILAPRDFGVARIATILGMSAGLAVGLFFADPTVTKVGTITVSAAGLAFLAGFGAEAFFSFLDGVLSKLLPPTVSSSAPVPPSV